MITGKSVMCKGLLLASAAVAACGAWAEDPAILKAKIEKDYSVTSVDKFVGFDRINFDFKGYKAWICVPPEEVREDAAWSWVMQWADAYVERTNVPQLLKAGYRHVTIDTFNHRMDKTGIAISAEFQKYLVEKLGFAPKAYLIGMSWGGWFSIRYAAYHPENVAKIYLDGPLLTFSKFGHNIGPWKEVAPADGDWSKNPEMPINFAEKVAKSGIPVLLLYGGQDQTCNPAINAEAFDTRFRAAGGSIRKVLRHLYGHHPHGVEVNENTIKDFFESDIPKPVINEDVPSEPRLVELGKPQGENAWFILTFRSKSVAQRAWSVNFYDADKHHISGTGANSVWLPSEDWTNNEKIVPTPPDAVYAKVEFSVPAEVRDIVLRRVEAEDGFLCCRRIYAEGPKLKGAPDKSSWKELVNSGTQIRVDKEFRIVFLGDSIMSDTWCGGFGAILSRDFPATKIVMYPSIRNATGTLYYQKEENFKNAVARYRPNLVVIGGKSNINRKTMDEQEAEEALVKTIERCKAIGAEVAVATSASFGDKATGFQKRAAERTGAAYWDFQSIIAKTVEESGKDIGWFKRDAVHANDRGKQIISTLMSDFFRVVK